MNIPLASKRQVLRNKADFENHFICTMEKAPYGVWLNVNKLGELSKEERVQLLSEVLSWLYG